jgi:hypothetical protein
LGTVNQQKGVENSDTEGEDKKKEDIMKHKTSNENGEGHIEKDQSITEEQGQNTSGRTIFNSERSYPVDYEFRGPAILFHDESHTNEAQKLSNTLKALNFRCQTLPHEPTDTGYNSHTYVPLPNITIALYICFRTNKPIFQLAT